MAASRYAYGVEKKGDSIIQVRFFVKVFAAREKSLYRGKLAGILRHLSKISRFHDNDTVSAGSA
jgi:hypothetical protein